LRRGQVLNAPTMVIEDVFKDQLALTPRAQPD
jgi:hypothetical protein